MSITSIVVLAVGLAMDATAVSAARGLALPCVQLRHVGLVAVYFGGFQGSMPLLGWFLGARIGSLVDAWDHWVAFVLLGAIGGKMLWEARGPGDRLENGGGGDPFRLEVMTVLAIATSIDALAAGFALPLLDAPLLLSAVTIGVTTALLSGIGLCAGHRFGAVLGKRLEVAGGLVLIGLGTKILIEHLRV